MLYDMLTEQSFWKLKTREASEVTPNGKGHERFIYITMHTRVS